MRWFSRRNRLAPLGDGLWRRAHDRFRRAVDRFHQMIEGVAPGPVRAALDIEGERLATALDEVFRICVASQILTPSSGLEIPPGADVVHRALSKASTSAAQACESAAMARVAERAGDRATATARLVAANRAVGEALSAVSAARSSSGSG